MPAPSKNINPAMHIDKQLPGECALSWIIRRNVRGRREHLGLSMTDMAQAIEVSVPHMAHLETGRNISVKSGGKQGKLIEFNNRKLERAAEALSCDANELLIRYKFFKP